MTTTPTEMLLTDDELLACLVEASCIGTVKMSFEIGPYYIDRPTINATLLAEALQRALLARLSEQQQPVAWRVRWRDAPPEYWTMFPREPVEALADPKRETQPLYAAPVPTPAAQAAQAVPAEIMAICHRLHTQDNRITDNPLFAVQERREIAGLDDGYADAWAWVNDDCEEITDPDEVARLEAAHANGDDTPGARRVGMTHRWEFVTGCLTEQGCKDYIKANGHNLHSPRIYAYGSYRNAEFIALRKWLKSLAAPTPTGAGDDHGGGHA
ncbi:hypothetical protein MW290_24740 [Aquincola tertiaricarbonis]|uniref:Uncharacterized protein n=1 Tax=Aquincola tertiaricarbonis TaxID=391953 RepID=A0ABY4S717_AQUTE|nr:hypothetical protein [Aquincola tertiaricarbonis]URI08788.1 hypothetical protein MW290_24740 [Aquincola tertiaricarbonis]